MFQIRNDFRTAVLRKVRSKPKSQASDLRMKFDDVAILLLCHSLDDFPVFYRGKDAETVLAHWTAMWHPQLIAQCRRMPAWYRVDELPSHDRARLLLLPVAQHADSPEGLARDVAAAGGLLIEQQNSRDEILRLALSPDAETQTVDGELAADFMALGYAYLQIELLTRQMRYATQVAETAFADNLVAAADAAVSGDDTQARQLLQSCFDLLSQERNHYYAVDVYLIDLSLVADSLLGQPLQRQLRRSAKSNLLIEAQLLERLERDEPASWQLLREALDENRVGLIGGELEELPLSLLSTDTVWRQFNAGLQAFEQRLQRRPQVYGRRRFGLTPVLPQVLLRLDFAGALHATFDGGRFPEATQAKSRWEGDGQFSIDAITRAPLDATEAATFLNLATKLSESMDTDHIATRCFVHWAGDVSPWYEELQRAARYTHSLGRFVTVDEYFQSTYDPGIHDRFTADQYRSPWLRQQVSQHDTRPVSCWVAYWRRCMQLQTWLNCCALWLLIDDCEAARQQWAQAESCMNEFSRRPLHERDAHELSDDDVQSETNRSAAGLARAILGGSAAEPDAAATFGYTLVNTLSFPRRVNLEACTVVPDEQAPVYGMEKTTTGSRVVADIPAVGLAQVLASSGKRHVSRKSSPPIASEHVLRNEFLEAHVDPRSGAILTLRDYRDRNNRLSQQIAHRSPAGDYSSMAADSVRVLDTDSLRGQIQSRGQLLDDAGKVLANFVQTLQLWRGSRVVEVDIEIEPQVELTDQPWDHYFACRFAWSNEAADVSRALNEVRRPTSGQRFEAPLFVHLDDGSATTTILTGGLAFHRRSHRRMLDTLLITGRERQRRFRLGLGLDLKQPFREAIAFVSPQLIVPLPTEPTGPPSTWLFHIDARHVMSMTWQPVWENERVAGFRVRLVEVEGRTARVKLQAFRALASARKIDGQAQTVEICQVDGQHVMIPIASHEQTEVEVLFG